MPQVFKQPPVFHHEITDQMSIENTEMTGKRLKNVAMKILPCLAKRKQY